MFARVSSISLAMSLHATRVAHHLLDAGGEGMHVSRRNETLRGQQLGHAADTGCYCRQPASHRFEQRTRKALGQRRQNEQIRRVERQPDASRILLSQELDVRGKTEHVALSL